LINTSNLPLNWAVTSLESLIVYVIGGDWGKAVDVAPDEYSTAYCIRGSEFRNWIEDKGSTASLRAVKETSLLNRQLVENDILVEISGGGPEQPVGRTVLIDKECLSFQPDVPKIPTNFLRLTRPSNLVSSKYLNFYLGHFYKSGEVVNYQAGSNNLRNLKFNDYVGIDIPMPPENEQHRIVAKIEELFSELDRGIESLKTAREQLKVYRQALLKQAFEGKLTEQWRKENVDRLETADQLLERIKQERETRYQQQMEAWKAAVKQWETDDKEGKKPRKPKKLQENILEQDIVNELPNLLGVGVHAPLGDLIDEPKYGTSKKCTYNTNGNGVLRIPNVVSGRVDSADLKYAEFDDSELHDYVLVDGDVLLIRSNGSVSIVGKSALIEPKDTGFIYAGYLIRLRPNANLIISKYLLFSLEAHMLRKQIEAKAKSTSGVNNINSGEIRALIIPVVGLKEQSVIVGLLEEQLSVIDSSMFNVENNLIKSEALRQSILKKAFSGQLVPQDPNDEPASLLLERIAAEKAEAVAQAKKIKTAKKKAARKRS